MIEYRKKEYSDTWHWCENCSHYPKANYVTKCLPKGQRPATGELCNECLSKERRKDCKTRSCTR